MDQEKIQHKGMLPLKGKAGTASCWLNLICTQSITARACRLCLVMPLLLTTVKSQQQKAQGRGTSAASQLVLSQKREYKTLLPVPSLRFKYAGTSSIVIRLCLGIG